MSDDICMYPKCGVCNRGYLIPVDMGDEEKSYIKYRCTNPQCNVRFDLHGYERYDEEQQVWVRINSGDKGG